MKLCLINHSYKYELEKLIRIFLPFEKIEFSETQEEGDRIAVTSLVKGEKETLLSAKLLIDNKSYGFSESILNDIPDYDNECERLLAVALYNCFVSASGYVPEWGILTGVRPAKLFSRLCSSDGLSSAEDWFKKGLMVSENKISLCRETVESEGRITALSAPDSYSLYISIPFCPTRCAYCSFVSHSVEQAKNLIPDYIRLLKEELRLTAEIAKKLNLRLETVYIGGGTPTALSAEQLGEIMTAVKDYFDLNHLREYTVEAGRPDTVTADKLDTIKRLGATRISINPQTMNDDVLSVIGRRHTAKDTEEAFYLARKLGFNNINMDLIAGLPTDTFESFKSTVEKILGLNPESVTIHSLSMKRASTLSMEDALPEIEQGKTASAMVDYARETLSKNGILPYYMYRQSKTVGNLENVGYAKKGFEGLYNVYIMDETHTILACGASAVTKLREPDGNLISRIFNFKYPYEYISRFSEQLTRKDGIVEFYEKHPICNK
ncbi:MAG: coproporphyrinogen dehydrogenase HemZ [Oscillospiraceae bacterium]|nr:coproporphyrinogen dehydrogenase HemZ [Oscillospiraceae bacterium]